MASNVMNDDVSSSVETTVKELLDAAGLAYTGIARNDAAGQMIFSIEADDARALTAFVVPVESLRAALARLAPALGGLPR